MTRRHTPSTSTRQNLSHLMPRQMHLQHLIQPSRCNLNILGKNMSVMAAFLFIYLFILRNSPSPSPSSPGPGMCPPRPKSPSVQSRRCSAPQTARALRPMSQTRERWRGSGGRRPEILGRQSQATWCNESGRSPSSPPSTTKTWDVSCGWSSCRTRIVWKWRNHIPNTIYHHHPPQFAALIL